MEKLNLKEKFNDIQDYWSPQVVGEINDVYVKLARGKGEDIPWHNHANEDELFFIVEGNLLFEEEGKAPFTMNKGDMYIVKRGVNHRVSASDDCLIMLIENKTTAHTGTVETAITRSLAEQLGEK
ncbi:MAG: cupin domain-containing protein [Saprospiraceae bacterium]